LHRPITIEPEPDRKQNNDEWHADTELIADIAGAPTRLAAIISVGTNLTAILSSG
jgi:hypothetical protein